MAKARQITQRESWQRSRKRLRAFITALRQYGNIDFEKRLRVKLGNAEDSNSKRSLTQLLTELRGLEKVCEWWHGYSSGAPWKAWYRGYIWIMDKHLQKRCGELTQEHRVDIIAAAIREIHVESRVSSNSIAKSLERERKKPRRFVVHD